MMVAVKKYAWVDALRGYAVLLVILIHASQHFPIRWLEPLARNGDLGVQLFFILSSFTLFSSYAKHRQVDDPAINRNFYVRRFLRIAPYYYLAGFIYVIYTLFVTGEPVNVLKLAVSYLFLNSIVIPAISYIPPGGWSVGVEMLFYLGLPFLFGWIKSIRTAVVYCLTTVVASILLHFLLYLFITHYTDENWTVLRGWYFYFWLPNQLPIFMVGIVVYFLHQKEPMSQASGGWLTVLSIMLFVGCAYVPFDLNYPANFVQREYVYALILTMFVVGVYTNNNPLIINGFVQRMGVVSFSAYLNHFLIIYLLGDFYAEAVRAVTSRFGLNPNVFNNDLTFLVSYALVVLMTYYVSRFTYAKIEMPGIELSAKITRYDRKTSR